MTAVGRIEELLREALDRLDRQEQRTAALEAALFGSGSGSGVIQTPTPRSTDTAISLWPAPRRLPEPTPPAERVLVAAPVASVVDSLDDVIWSASPDGRLLFFVGGAVERLYGVTSQEFQDRPGRWLDAVWPEDREKFGAALARLTDTGSFRLEHRIRRTNHSARWAVTRGKLVRDPEGRPLRVDGCTTDVSRAAAPRAAVLAVLEGAGAATGFDFLRNLLRHLCDACDARAAAIVEPGAPGEARVAVAWAAGQELPPFGVPTGASAVRELLAGGSVLVPTGAGARFPNDPLLLGLRADALAAEPLVDGSGCRLGFLALASDRAFGAEAEVKAALKALAPRAAVELARAGAPPAGDQDARLAHAEARAEAAEAALRASANLASAGRIAAGVAHDFHNLLGVIAGNADLLQEGLPEGDPRRGYADTIARTAHTVATVSRQLVAVGKPAPRAPVPLDVGSAVRALEPVLRRLTGRKIPLGFELAPELPLVRIDATDFDRIVLNLVLNARDASRYGDAITVRAAAAAIAPEYAGWPADLPPGEYVALTVADQGCGMSAEVRAKMFDLFFTTKGENGSGLGLATVRDAVGAARGHIEVESDPGWGTTVRVYWPAL